MYSTVYDLSIYANRHHQFIRSDESKPIKQVTVNENCSRYTSSSFMSVTMSQSNSHDAINNDNNKPDDHAHDIVMPGFRFHPTEEELVEFYLRRKVEGKPFNVELITFLDLYRYDPWELPGIYYFILYIFNHKVIVSLFYKEFFNKPTLLVV